MNGVHHTGKLSHNLSKATEDEGTQVQFVEGIPAVSRAEIGRIRSPSESSTSARKSPHHRWERNATDTLAQALDELQAVVWKEKVDTCQEKRPRLEVLQKSAAYISLLTSVLDGNVSEELSAEVSQFVSMNDDDDDAKLSKTEVLQQILASFEEESRIERRSVRSRRERVRIGKMLEAVDELQRVVWKENVDTYTRQERRPRLAVLQRSIAYISLLMRVVNGTVSEQLSADVSRFVLMDGRDDRVSKATALRQILTRYEEELRAEQELLASVDFPEVNIDFDVSSIDSLISMIDAESPIWPFQDCELPFAFDFPEPAFYSVPPNEELPINLLSLL